MGKKYKLRTIKAKRSYSFKEIGILLKVHVRTVQEWHLDGLEPIVGSNSPYLVLGSEIKRYLAKRSSKNKVKLKLNEVYCMGCRKAVVPVNVETIVVGTKMGGFKSSVRINGICPQCCKKVNRFTTSELLNSEDESNTV